MPSDARDIDRPYVAGELQWPIHRDASVCELLRGFGPKTPEQTRYPP